jgi:hypothetical protein
VQRLIVALAGDFDCLIVSADGGSSYGLELLSGLFIDAQLLAKLPREFG